MECWREAEAKQVHDPFRYTFHQENSMKPAAATDERRHWVEGPIIVGAGPSGLAVAACLKEKGVPSLILERSDCIASLWQQKMYDRLRLHIPKQFCELPIMPYPANFPTYPTKQQFLAYLQAYAGRFGIEPVFNQTVKCAEYDQKSFPWRVRTAATEYVSRWLVVATGENAEPVEPEIDGLREFKGPVVHTSAYRSGDFFAGKKVLVIGCGNSGMEVCLDLCNHDARPTLVVRESVHVLPREMLGTSTFGLSMWLLKWLPMPAVDSFLLFASRLVLGDTARLGLHRPRLGPLQLKSLTGKTPVLDVGTLVKIKAGHIKVRPAIKRLRGQTADFVDGKSEDFDAVILATGYKSNVPSWLKENEFFSGKDGLPRKPFPNGWKGERGLYAVGFTKRGILGASMDAKKIANDIAKCWNSLERS